MAHPAPTLNIAPTPWRVGPVDDTIVSAADRSEVAAIDGDYNDPDTWPIMEANARLIAAAPDLYAALAELQDLLVDWPTMRALSAVGAQRATEKKLAAWGIINAALARVAA